MGADVEINSVKSYVFLKVKHLFDPPATSYLIAAYERQMEEMEWRLNTRREETMWVDPRSTDVDDDELVEVVDGGTV